MENQYNQKRIFYVDDDPQSRMLVKHLIGKFYDLTLCSSAERALEILQKETFDLILLDIRLEGEMNGIELLAKLRNIPRHAYTPVVAITAYAFEEDKKQLLSAGFTDYISKPINLNHFKELARAYTEAQGVSFY